MRKGRSEIGTVDAAMSRALGRVDIFTATAEELDALFVRDIGEADGEKGLRSAENAWAPSEFSAFVLVEHLLETTGGDDPAGVDEAIQETCLNVERSTEFVLDLIVCKGVSTKAL